MGNIEKNGQKYNCFTLEQNIDFSVDNQIEAQLSSSEKNK